MLLIKKKETSRDDSGSELDCTSTKSRSTGVVPQVIRPGSQLPAICEQRFTTTAYGDSMYHLISCPIEA